MTFLKVPWAIKITKWMWVITQLSLCFPLLIFFFSDLRNRRKKWCLEAFMKSPCFFPALQLQRKEDLKRQTKTFLSSEFRAMHTAWKIFLCSCANVDSLSPWDAQPWGPAVCNPKPGLIQHSSVTLPKFPEKIVAKVWGSPCWAIKQDNKSKRRCYNCWDNCDNLEHKG